MSNTLMLGNEAVARGLWEAGCRFISSYPGTPSTEITEAAARYPAVYAEWAPNEKVAVEAAVGASFGGARSFSGMKHVGMNVAADPLFTAGYTGVGGGLVIAVADDPGMQSSQNEQDSRHYAAAAKLPMLEPSDSAECLAFTKLAFALSEAHDTPVLLRLSTRVSHARSPVETSDRAEPPLKAVVRDPAKYVMVPAAARGRHAAAEDRLLDLARYAETTELNRVEPGGRDIGVIASGAAYLYAREALGTGASYLKLGLVHPFPEKLIRDFAAGVKRVIVLEELDDVIETHCRKIGVAVQGKALFSFCGEYGVEDIRSKLLAAPAPDSDRPVPVRPPVLCPGCPHRGTFHVLSGLKLTVMGDIGCYTLGAAPPLAAMDFCLCMGASVSSLHGLVTVRPEMASRAVAVIGDSTFLHSGLTGLMNIVYNQSPATVLILDNATTGMTGHQPNPPTGVTLQGRPAPAADLEAICRALGVRRVRVADPHDLAALEAALKEELAAGEPSVVIVRRPCVLLPGVERKAPPAVIPEKCVRCRRCLRIGCPALRGTETGVSLDPALCQGCGLCAALCRFAAIVENGGSSCQNTGDERRAGGQP